MKKIGYFLLCSAIAASILVLEKVVLPSVHFPPNIAFDFFAGFYAKPSYIPFDCKEPYATVTPIRKNQNKVTIYYEGVDQKLQFEVTNDLESIDDPKWRKDSVLAGANYRYVDAGGAKVLEWQNLKRKLQFALIYTGKKDLPKEELIKVAESVR
jgi:hypothetical protein